MENLIYEKRIRDFAEDCKNVKKWFRKQLTVKQIVTLHQELNEIGYEYKRYFKNKGEYKTVKRLFTREAALYLTDYILDGNTVTWDDITSDFAWDIIVKSWQGWIPLETARVKHRRRQNGQKRYLPYGLWEFMLDKAWDNIERELPINNKCSNYESYVDCYFADFFKE